MSGVQHPFLMLMPAFLLGSALQLQQRELWPGPWYAWLLLGGLILLLAARRQPARRWAGTLLSLVAGVALAFGQAGWRAASQWEDQLPPRLEGRDLQVTGMVAAMPQRNEGGLRFRFDVETARLGGALARVPPRIHLGWYGESFAGEGQRGELQPPPAELRPGQRWQMTVRLKAPHGNSNPHGFDYELWLWEQGLQATGYVRAGRHDPPARLLGATWQHPVERARQTVRDAIFERITEPKLAGVLAALVVGDQAAIERADWDIFRATGVAHLMSISGLHVTMFAWAAGLCVGWLWRRSVRLCLWLAAPEAALGVGVMLAGGYALFSGWGLPAQRTVCMLATVALLCQSGRVWPWPQVWLLAMAVVVAMDPWALLQAGFWLSFVAVGVLFASDDGKQPAAPVAAPQAAPSRRERLQAWLVTHGASALREQWVVTLALTPLGLLLFQQVSLVGLLANAVAIPWVTAVLTPLAMLGVFWHAAWDAAALAAQGLGWFLGLLAALPMASVSVAAPAVWAGIFGVLGGLLLAMKLPWGLRAAGLPLLLPALLWQAPRPPAGEFELLAADIGQGNAVLVRTAGHALLYDSGPRFSRESDAGHRTIVPLLRALDEHLDVLMLSHRDSDHTGGARAVLQMQPQARLISSLEDRHELLSLSHATRCQAGQRWEWDGVLFQVLHPLAEDYLQLARPNAMSCVLRVSSAQGRASALLVGDIELPQEAALLARQAPLAADVLLVPHHGSKTSSGAAFLDQVRPGLGLVQAGYRNRFGHPAPPVSQRYEALGVRLVDSPRCGAARWASQRPTEVVCQREQDLRYWHHRVP